jgi:soluble lytic murein transglycosylase-like protein
MSKQIYWHFMVSRVVWILFFSLATGSFTRAYSYTDTSKKKLLAAANKNKEAGFVTLEANVVFPDVLIGNEAEALLYIEKFAVNRRAYLIRTYNRSKKYFPKVGTILKKYDLPNELSVLLALESAFNANAVSKAGAVGYWQIMDDVAREYGLKYVAKQHIASKKKQQKKTIAGKAVKKPAPARDDRKNFNKSTYAAARYLKDRSRNLNNDLLLMVASYNCGVGNVWEAMKKTGMEDPDFWDIKDYLPAETRAYVMNFITLNVIFHNYEKFANNTLLFTPSKIKVDNFEGIMTEELPAASSTNN